MNKIWEVIEKESHEGSRGYKGYRKHHDDDSMGTSYRMGRRDDDVKEAYECGFEDGYSEAMKKIFHIIKNAE